VFRIYLQIRKFSNNNKDKKKGWDCLTKNIKEIKATNKSGWSLNSSIVISVNQCSKSICKQKKLAITIKIKKRLRLFNKKYIRD